MPLDDTAKCAGRPPKVLTKGSQPTPGVGGRVLVDLASGRPASSRESRYGEFETSVSGTPKVERVPHGTSGRSGVPFRSEEA